jgi:hypothetical protein
VNLVETTQKNNFKAKFMWRLACRLARRMLLTWMVLIISPLLYV